jgi:hypothetical protein
MAVKTHFQIDLGNMKCQIDGVLSYWRLLLRQPLGQPALVGCCRHRDPARPRAISRGRGMAGTVARVLEHSCSSFKRPPAACGLASYPY